MLTQPISAVLVGAGGYGELYLWQLLEHLGSVVRLVGVVEPQPERCKRLDALRAAGIPLVGTLAEFYERQQADLALIASPIQFHCPQTREALAHGSDVLCEKPVAATIQDVREMMRARDAAGRLVAVGYQWSFSTAAQQLKADVLSGMFGAPRQLKTIVRWPRDKAYYTRNTWAGALRDAQGRWVLDSPVNNATAHYLHHMLYLLGDAVDRSAAPREIEGELYRANPITNYDTAALRCRTTRGTEVLFYTTHAARETRHPEFRFEFERAVITNSGAQRLFTALFSDGRVKDYGSPDTEPGGKIVSVADAIVRGAPVLCGLEAAASHTLCVNGLQDSTDICDFPRDLVKTECVADGNTRVWVDGLDAALDECYDAGVLPTEHGMAWAKKGRLLNLTGYRSFPGRAAAGGEVRFEI